MDWINAILTGFFTGIGVSTANYFHEKKIKDKLDKIDDKIKGIKWH